MKLVKVDPDYQYAGDELEYVVKAGLFAKAKYIKQNASYLLSGKFPISKKDKNTKCHVVYLPCCDAKDVASINNPENRSRRIDHLIDKNTFISSLSEGTIPQKFYKGLQESLELNNCSYEKVQQAIYALRQQGEFKDYKADLFLQVLKESERKVDSISQFFEVMQDKVASRAEQKYDVFDEIGDLLKSNEEINVKIVQAFNKGNFHWNKLKTVIKRYKGPDGMSKFHIDIHLNDPMGGRNVSLDKENFRRYKKALVAKLVALFPQKDAEEIKKRIKVVNHVITQEAPQQFDGASCGVVVAENLVEDILLGDDRRRTFPAGAKAARRKHLKHIDECPLEYCNEVIKRNFKAVATGVRLTNTTQTIPIKAIDIDNDNVIAFDRTANSKKAKKSNVSKIAIFNEAMQARAKGNKEKALQLFVLSGDGRAQRYIENLKEELGKATVEKANAAKERGDLTKAVQFYQQGILRYQNVESMVACATIFADVKSTFFSPLEAFNLFTCAIRLNDKSAKQALVVFQKEVGDLYCGLACREMAAGKVTEALEMLNFAIKFECTKAMNIRAKMHQKGNDGLGVNLQEARRLLELSESLGDPCARHQLNFIEIEKKSNVYDVFELAIEQFKKNDTENALKNFQKAVKQTNSVRKIKGYLFFEHGQGRNVALASEDVVKFYEFAAQKASPEAMNNLGVLHMLGLGVGQIDKKMAKKYFEQASEVDLVVKKENKAKHDKSSTRHKWTNEKRIPACPEAALNLDKMPGKFIVFGWRYHGEKAGLAYQYFAEKGNPRAQYQLVKQGFTKEQNRYRRYNSSLGGDEHADLHIAQALSVSYPPAMVEKARKLLQDVKLEEETKTNLEQKKAEAKDLLLKACEQYYAPAMREMYRLLSDGGKNVTEEAEFFLSHAVMLGDPIAMRLKGDLCVKAGELRPAAMLYSQAMLAGNSRAGIKFAQAVEKGHGIPKNPKQALNIYAFVARWEHKKAQEHFDRLKAKIGEGIFANAEQVNRSGALEQSRTLYEESAQYGNPKAMLKLGEMFEKGLGGAKDLEKSLAYYVTAKNLGKKEAEPGVTRVAKVLAKEFGDEAKSHHMNGEFRKARIKYKKALDLGDGTHAESYAQLLEKGLGGSVQKKQAMGYYAHAAQQNGSKDAERAAKRIYRELNPLSVGDKILIAASATSGVLIGLMGIGMALETGGASAGLSADMLNFAGWMLAGAGRQVTIYSINQAIESKPITNEYFTQLCIGGVSGAMDKWLFGQSNPLSFANYKAELLKKSRNEILKAAAKKATNVACKQVVMRLVNDAAYIKFHGNEELYKQNYETKTKALKTVFSTAFSSFATETARFFLSDLALKNCAIYAEGLREKAEIANDNLTKGMQSNFISNVIWLKNQALQNDSIQRGISNGVGVFSARQTSRFVQNVMQIDIKKLKDRMYGINQTPESEVLNADNDRLRNAANPTTSILGELVADMTSSIGASCVGDSVSYGIKALSDRMMNALDPVMDIDLDGNVSDRMRQLIINKRTLQRDLNHNFALFIKESFGSASGNVCVQATRILISGFLLEDGYNLNAAKEDLRSSLPLMAMHGFFDGSKSAMQGIQDKKNQLLKAQEAIEKLAEKEREIALEKVRALMELKRQSERKNQNKEQNVSKQPSGVNTPVNDNDSKQSDQAKDNEQNGDQNQNSQTNKNQNGAGDDRESGNNNGNGDDDGRKQNKNNPNNEQEPDQGVLREQLEDMYDDMLGVLEPSLQELKELQQEVTKLDADIKANDKEVAASKQELKNVVLGALDEFDKKEKAASKSQSKHENGSDVKKWGKHFKGFVKNPAKTFSEQLKRIPGDFKKMAEQLGVSVHGIKRAFLEGRTEALDKFEKMVDPDTRVRIQQARKKLRRLEVEKGKNLRDKRDLVYEKSKRITDDLQHKLVDPVTDALRKGTKGFSDLFKPMNDKITEHIAPHLKKAFGDIVRGVTAPEEAMMKALGAIAGAMGDKELQAKLNKQADDISRASKEVGKQAGEIAGQMATAKNATRMAAVAVSALAGPAAPYVATALLAVVKTAQGDTVTGKDMAVDFAMSYVGGKVDGATQNMDPLKQAVYRGATKAATKNVLESVADGKDIDVSEFLTDVAVGGIGGGVEQELNDIIPDGTLGDLAKTAATTGTKESASQFLKTGKVDTKKVATSAVGSALNSGMSKVVNGGVGLVVGSGKKDDENQNDYQNQNDQSLQNTDECFGDDIVPTESNLALLDKNEEEEFQYIPPSSILLDESNEPNQSKMYTDDENPFSLPNWQLFNSKNSGKDSNDHYQLDDDKNVDDLIFDDSNINTEDHMNDSRILNDDSDEMFNCHEDTMFGIMPPPSSPVFQPELDEDISQSRMEQQNENVGSKDENTKRQRKAGKNSSVYDAVKDEITDKITERVVDKVADFVEESIVSNKTDKAKKIRNKKNREIRKEFPTKSGRAKDREYKRGERRKRYKLTKKEYEEAVEKGKRLGKRLGGAIKNHGKVKDALEFIFADEQEREQIVMDKTFDLVVENVAKAAGLSANAAFSLSLLLSSNKTGPEPTQAEIDRMIKDQPWGQQKQKESIIKMYDKIKRNYSEDDVSVEEMRQRIHEQAKIEFDPNPNPEFKPDSISSVQSGHGL